MPRDYITIVSGLPRSGTSLMMQMLQAGGLPVLTDSLREADASNPHGYLEYDPVKHLRTDRSWLPQACGHAVKIIHLLLRELPMDGSLTYRIIFMERPMAEVLASQQAMLQRDGKPGADPAILRRAFTTQLAEVTAWLKAQPHLRLLTVSYHRLLTEPSAVAEELCAFLDGDGDGDGDLDLDPAAMQRAIDPALHRQRQQWP